MNGTAGYTGKKALVVDDVFLNRIVLGKTLQNNGFEVAYAENGLEACKSVVAGGIDIVFMDLMMPVMDGFDAITNIRKSEDPKVNNVPIIAISANCNQNEPERSVQCGADFFIAKPFEGKDLLKKIRDSFALRENK